jgi:arylsulfatase A-like enzyme/Tfp pilus assembly protein PilF
MIRRATGLSLLLLLAACGSSAEEGPTSLLLVTFDTTRADRIGCYGYEDARTPRVDALAADGVRFANAYTPAPVTLPSHATLMTGLLPPEHGLRDNGVAGLGDELPTMAEVFRDNGYRTGAVIGAFVLDARFGLARGFEHYEDNLALDGGAEERHADAVATHAIRWLATVEDEPFLLWVHFFDPHATYAPPPEFAGRGTDPYDGEIAFVDRELGRVLDHLDDAGRLDSTLVVVTSDHGEALGDHGEPSHAAFVYRSTMSIPLVFQGPGVDEGGLVVDAQAGLVDVLPTLIDLFDFTPPASFTGRSLAPALRGGELADAPVYGESEYVRRHYGWSPLHSLRADGWTYVRAPRPELYDLSVDPNEENDVAALHPERVAEFEARLSRLEAGLRATAATSATLDDEVASKLGGLGYVAGDEEGERAVAIDAKDKKETLVAFTRGLELLSQGDAAGAIELLERCVRDDPGSRTFHHELGVAYSRGKRFGKAEIHLRLALDIDPDNPNVRSDLGNVFLESGRVPEAKAEYRRVLEAHPGHANARRNLVAILLHREETAAAIEVLRAGLAQKSWDAPLQIQLAQVLLAAKDPALRDPSEALRLALAADAAAGGQDARARELIDAARAAGGVAPGGNRAERD